jgi:hypothetical protein
MALATGLAMICVLVPATQPASAATQTSPITYVYDSLGRLEAAIDPVNTTSGLARYT